MYRSRFKAEELPWQSSNLIIGTSRTNNVRNREFGAPVHFYRGATLRDLIEVVQQYPPLNLNSVTIVAGFNDHGKPSSKVRLFFKKLIEIVTYKFQPSSIIVPQIIPSESNSFINRIIFNHNCKLYNLFKYFQPGPKIVHPRLSCFFDKSYCRDGFHFSYYRNFVLTNVLRTLIQMFSFC